MAGKQQHDVPRAADSKQQAASTVTQLGALSYCSAAFGIAVVVVSAFSYKRGLSKLRAEGISEEEAHRAVPYAAQALGIASACIGGVGLAATGVVYASGVNMKSTAQVSSVQDALQTANQAGAWMSAKLRRWGEQNVAPLLPPMAAQDEERDGGLKRTGGSSAQ